MPLSPWGMDIGQILVLAATELGQAQVKPGLAKQLGCHLFIIFLVVFHGQNINI